jgi:hypothetical protein
MIDRELYREIRRMIAPIEARAKLAVSRAIVNAIKDTVGIQSLKSTMMLDEVDDYAHMQPGGMTHVPLPGAEGIFLSVGGNRGDGVVICVSDRRHRPKGLAGGETAIFNDSATTQTVLKIAANGDVAIALAPGAALKVGTGAEPVLRGLTFVAALNTFVAAVSAYAAAAGTALPLLAPAGATLSAAATAFSTALGTVQSTVIKGS